MPVTVESRGQTEVENRVAEAAVQAWKAAGEDVLVLPWAQLAKALSCDVEVTDADWVVVRNRRQVECVVEHEKALDRLRSVFEAFLLHGWQPSAVVPLHTMGAAHDAFGGLPVHLQGWLERDDRPRFTAPEIA